MPDQPTSRPRLVVWCCYVGMFIQALVTNLTPLLFIPLKEELGLTFEQIGRLVLINFTTQLLVDLMCVGLVDRVDVKPFVVIANVLAGAGLWVFAVAPARMAEPYHGLVLGTVVFSAGCGLLEVLLSPIINAVQVERKEAQMALLHAFYPIGKVAVIVVTGLALYLYGAGHWRTVVVAWSVMPVVNTVAFLSVRLPRLHGEPGREGQRALLRRPAYAGVLLAMVLAGATELTIAQWTSAFAERGLGFSKAVGDLVGFCLFGIGMAAGRLWFGFKGEAVDLYRWMIGGAAASVVLYLVASLSPWPVVALAACAAAGLTVSLLWPGTLSLSAARFPLAGTAMFALLAAAGDTGAAVMPWVVGLIADRATAALPHVSGAATPAESGLRWGILAATLCPLAMVAVLAWLRHTARRQVSPARIEPALRP